MKKINFSLKEYIEILEIGAEESLQNDTDEVMVVVSNDCLSFLAIHIFPTKGNKFSFLFPIEYWLGSSYYLWHDEFLNSRKEMEHIKNILKNERISLPKFGAQALAITGSPYGPETYEVSGTVVTPISFIIPREAENIIDGFVRDIAPSLREWSFATTDFSSLPEIKNSYERAFFKPFTLSTPFGSNDKSMEDAYILGAGKGGVKKIKDEINEALSEIEIIKIDDAVKKYFAVSSQQYGTITWPPLYSYFDIPKVIALSRRRAIFLKDIAIPHHYQYLMFRTIDSGKEEPNIIDSIIWNYRYFSEDLREILDSLAVYKKKVSDKYPWIEKDTFKSIVDKSFVPFKEQIFSNKKNDYIWALELDAISQVKELYGYGYHIGLLS